MLKYLLIFFFMDLSARITKIEVIRMHNNLINLYNEFSGNIRLENLLENDRRTISVINHEQMVFKEP